MKKEEHNPMEPTDKQHFKKKYLLRKQEEVEAEKEARNYDVQEADSPTREEQVPQAQCVAVEGGSL